MYTAKRNIGLSCIWNLLKIGRRAGRRLAARADFLVIQSLTQTAVLLRKHGGDVR